MIQHVRVSRHKGLRQPAQLHLGKVTALCGRNGSGKSTILEALARPDGFELGIDTDELTERLATIHLQSIGAQDDLTFYLRQLMPNKAVLTDALPVAYSGGVDEAVGATIKWLRSVPSLGNRNPNVQFYKGEYKALFPTLPSLALLPVKRLVHPVVGLQPGEPLQPNGTGLLNDLFFLSAQPSRSAERQLFERIHSTFAELTDGQEPILTPSKQNQLSLFFRRPEQGLIAAQDSGQGLIDLLLLLRFILGPEARLVMIEEPELHIHADLQRRVNILLQEVPEKQFLLATHSSVHLNPATTDVILLARYDQDISVSNATSRAAALADLGYSLSDNLASEGVLLTEGPYDGEAYRVLLRKLGLTPSESFRTWPLGGDIMDKLDLEVLSSHYRVVAIVDKDPKSQVVRKRFAKRCEAAGVPCHVLAKRSLEYYFPIQAIRRVFPETPSSLPAFLDEKASIADQLPFSLKRSLHRLAEETELGDLKDTDMPSILAAVAHHIDGREDS